MNIGLELKALNAMNSSGLSMTLANLGCELKALNSMYRFRLCLT